MSDTPKKETDFARRLERAMREAMGYHHSYVDQCMCSTCTMYRILSAALEVEEQNEKGMGHGQAGDGGS